MLEQRGGELWKAIEAEGRNEYSASFPDETKQTPKQQAEVDYGSQDRSIL